MARRSPPLIRPQPGISLFSQLAKKDPDSFTNASALLGDLTGTAAKRIRTAAISPHMRPERNRSASFQLFLKNVKQWLEEAS